MRRRTSHLKRVLLIAKNYQASGLCKRLSDAANVLCRNVGTIEEAEAVIENRPPHVVVMDFKLGGQDGVKLVKWLLKTTARRKIPVILICDEGTNWQTQGFEERGVYATLVSPFRLSELSMLILEASKKTERAPSNGDLVSHR